MTTALFATCLPLAGLGIWLNITGNAETGNLLMAIANWGLFLANVAAGFHLSASINGTAAVITTWFWWRGCVGRRTRKTLRQLGAKSRARIAALVRQMTPSPVPTPA